MNKQKILYVLTSVTIAGSSLCVIPRIYTQAPGEKEWIKEVGCNNKMTFTNTLPYGAY